MSTLPLVSEPVILCRRSLRYLCLSELEAREQGKPAKFYCLYIFLSDFVQWIRFEFQMVFTQHFSRPRGPEAPTMYCVYAYAHLIKATPSLCSFVCQTKALKAQI